MKLIATRLKGAYEVIKTPFVDQRGSFMRTYCANEFKELNLATHMVQTNLSITHQENTIRGMHLQINSAQEDKLVQCLRGAILDVIIDLRPDSATFAQSIAVELTDNNHKMLYVPRGFAHGFLTLTEDCHVLYQVSNYYTPGKELGIRWNDPFFKINWPVDQPHLSEKDAKWPDFETIKEQFTL